MRIRIHTLLISGRSLLVPLKHLVLHQFNNTLERDCPIEAFSQTKSCLPSFSLQKNSHFGITRCHPPLSCSNEERACSKVLPDRVTLLCPDFGLQSQRLARTFTPSPNLPKAEAHALLAAMEIEVSEAVAKTASWIRTAVGVISSLYTCQGFSDLTIASHQSPLFLASFSQLDLLTTVALNKLEQGLRWVVC
jgi:hypothetical protein